MYFLARCLEEAYHAINTEFPIDSPEPHFKTSTTLPKRQKDTIYLLLGFVSSFKEPSPKFHLSGIYSLISNPSGFHPQVYFELSVVLLIICNAGRSCVAPKLAFELISPGEPGCC